MSAEVPCCREMEEQLENTCEDHDDPWNCPDIIVVRMQAGMIGLPVRDGGRSAILIDYCPWCGAGLKTLEQVAAEELG